MVKGGRYMERLRELRKSKGISLKELGAIIGVAESTMSLYESGKRQPDYETLLKLAEYYGVTVDYLLRGSEEEQLPEELVILNRKARNWSPEKRKQLLDMARVMFKEDFND